MINIEEGFELEDIIEKTLKSIEESKDEVFGIVKHVKEEVDFVKKKLYETKENAKKAINDVDRFKIKNQIARNRLAVVSRDFKNFDESDIKNAYKKASDILVEYNKRKFIEKELIEKRNELERRLINTKKILKSGEKLIDKINIAFDFLSNGIMNYNTHEPETNEDKINFAIQLLEVREAEKKRISREIHDGPAQSLAGIVFQAEVCSEVLKKDFDKGLKEIDGLKLTVKDTLKEIRNIIYELRPMSIDDIGLVPTINRLIKNFEKKESIKIDFKSSKIKKDLDKFVELTIFRVVQEILNNIKKHSNASKAKIRLSFGTVFMTLKVEDNGKGFDVNQTIDKVKLEGEHFGLIGMQNRIKELMGEMKIDSSLNKGTKIYVKIPINKGVMLNEIKSD